MASPARAARLVAAARRSATDAIPPSERVQQFVRDEHPDVVLVTPHLMPALDRRALRAQRGGDGRADRRSASPAGTTSPASSCSASSPTCVTVWNDTQKEEAIELHGVPADRVVVDGRAVLRPLVRLAAAAARGVLRARRARSRRSRTSSTWAASLFPTTMTEAEYCREWIEAVRASDEPALRDGGHPDPAASEADRGVAGRATSADLDDVVVWPRTSTSRPSRTTRADYFDSIYHRAVVFGINTTRDDRGRDHRQGGAHDHRARVRRLAGRRAPLPLPARGRRRARPGLGRRSTSTCGGSATSSPAATPRARRRRAGSPSCSSGRTASRCRRRPSSSTRSRSSSQRGPRERQPRCARGSCSCARRSR